MNIVALDLGIHTGFAHNDGFQFDSGTWVFKGKADRDLDYRVSDFYGKLYRLLEHRLGSPIYDWVVFEDVQFSTYTYQTQLWASFRAAMWLACYHRGLRCKGVPVGTLKKFATGHGGATKEMMAAWAVKRFAPRLYRGSDGTVRSQGTNFKVDDNEIDAIHLHDLATHNELYLLNHKLP
jgi:Holliday junction resolvasome RuvABC endonuclease subunit